MKPMLAGDGNVESVSLPTIASPKLDGIRCLIKNGVPVSRSLIAIPNRFIQSELGGYCLEGSDGELVVGNPTDPLVFSTTSSGVMSEDGTPDFHYYKFDRWDSVETYQDRLEQISVFPNGRASALEWRFIESRKELKEYLKEKLEQGYEGIIVRDPNGRYKFGRSTVREGGMLKLKPFQDSEAVVLGMEPLYHNGNSIELDNLGHTKRSSKKNGMVRSELLGSLTCKDVKSGVEFSVGTGFDAGQRQEIYLNFSNYLGKMFTYTFQGTSKNKPRFPVFKGWRNPMDI